MKVRLKTPRAGHKTIQGSDGKPVVQSYSQSIGDVIDVGDDEARRMIDRGQADPVSSEKQGGDRR